MQIIPNNGKSWKVNKLLKSTPPCLAQGTGKEKGGEKSQLYILLSLNSDIFNPIITFLQILYNNVHNPEHLHRFGGNRPQKLSKKD